MAEEIYYCESCGGVMEYDVASKTLKCPNCGNGVQILNDTDSIIEHKLTLSAKNTIKPAEKTSSTMECTGCGAMIEVEGNVTATECPYCGSQYVLAKKQLDAIIPDGIIPFSIDKNRVNEIFRNWIKKRWLAPGELKTLYQNDKMQGIYLPYWTFDAQADSEYTAMGGKNRTEVYEDKDGNSHTKTVTDWYHTRGRVSNFFDDVLVNAVNSEKAHLLKGVEPYNTKETASYSPQYISGYSSQCFDVDLESAHKTARKNMDAGIKELARKQVLKKYDEVKDIRINPRYTKETYKHIIIPVYSTSYKYKDKIYNVVINGQNGKIKGDYPKSPLKIALIVIAVVIALIGLYLFSSEPSSDGRYGYNYDSENTYMAAEYYNDTTTEIDEYIDEMI